MAAVEKHEDGWAYQCPDCGFVSHGHENKGRATARGQQHKAEHADSKPMVELIGFETEAS